MALIPAHFSNAVAALEKMRAVEGEDRVEWDAIATGTILGFKTGKVTEDDDELFGIFLVTNKHVIEGEQELHARFNQGEQSERFAISIRDNEGSPQFVESPEFDVAVIRISAGYLKERGADFGWIPEQQLLTLDGLEEEGVAGGDGVFVIGFPMGLAGKERMYVVVRSGSVARLDREIVEETHAYLIDCTVFPGNSGGPVVLRPEK